MTRKVLISLLLLMMMGGAVVWAGDFNHQAHLDDYASETSCDACHLTGAQSIVPDSKVCLECHSQTEVADVSLGQTMTHGPTWSLNHRAEAKGATSNCSACHAQEYCLDCHKSGFADEMGEVGNNMVNVHRDDFMVSHPISARADQNRCSSCHESRFCSECHNEWRFKSSDIGSPSHRRTFDKGLTGVDIDVIHAGINSSLACDACHTGASMDFHTWSVGHAREARRSLATCQACHPDGETCLKCHSARGGALGFNPHPKDWDNMKGRLQRASNGRTCRKCH